MASTEENSPDLNPTEHDLKRAPNIPRILLNWNSFVKIYSPKFLLTVVQVWSATTENVSLRLFLSKEGQPVITRVHILFPPCTVNVYTVCSTKTWKRVIVCVLSVQADCVCLLLWPSWRSDQLLWPIYAEIQAFPKGSHTFSCHSIFLYAQLTRPLDNGRPKEMASSA